MGEGVGQGVGVGVGRFWCFSVLGRGKWGGRVFSLSDYFLEGGCVAGQVFVFVCVKEDAAPLVCV